MKILLEQHVFEAGLGRLYFLFREFPNVVSIDLRWQGFSQQEVEAIAERAGRNVARRYNDAEKQVNCPKCGDEFFVRA